MDEAPNNYMDIGHRDLYSSTIPWSNEFDFGEEADLSKIFDLPQEQHVNTNNTSIESSPKHHQNSENVLESPSDGINQENPKIFTPIHVMEKQCDTSNISRSDQENSKTNGVLLQQPLQKISILEKFEREAASLKSKFTIDQPLKTSTNPPTTNGMILQQPMSNILTSEKLKSHLMRSKSMVVGHENGIFKQGIDHSGGYGILNSMDNNELFPQNTSTNRGPIRRSPDRRISSRYQPYFGRQIVPNNIEGKSDSCQVAEIGKQNGNNEEDLIGRSSNLVNHSNHIVQHSPAYTHEITNMKVINNVAHFYYLAKEVFKGVASGINLNQYTQWNEDGAPDQLESSRAQSWNAQLDSHFNITTNWPRGPFQLSNLRS